MPPLKEQEARVGQEAPQREQQRPRQGETPVTPSVGKRQEVAPKKGFRSGTRLARYQRQIDLIQRQGNGCRDDDE